MKRMIAAFLIFCLCLTVLPIAVSADNTPITLYGYATYSEDESVSGQWVSFSDTNPADLTKLGSLREKLGQECFAATYARGMIYGYTSNPDAPVTTTTFWYAPASDPMDVHTVETDFTGQIEDMAYDYTHNYLYGIAWIGEGGTEATKYNDYALVSCSPTTGAVTFIGRLCYPGNNNGSYFNIITLAIDRNGKGYVLGNDGVLYALNLSTAKLSRIGEIGCSSEYVQSMCWDYDNDRLLWARESDEGEWGLYEVSTATGAAKFIGEIGTKDTEIVGLCMIPAKEPYIFRDVNESDWYFEGISYCYNSGLMNGMSRSTFEPLTSTSRAMVVTILYRTENSPSVTGVNPFKDVGAGEWYTDAVLWAAQNGIVNGMTETTFEPNSNITREQFATILYRYAEYKDYPCEGTPLSGFSDVDMISDYAFDAMSWAVADGLINGTADEFGKHLEPQGFANRAMIATILMRFVSGHAAG